MSKKLENLTMEIVEDKKAEERKGNAAIYREMADTFREVAGILDEVAKAVEIGDEESEEILLAKYLVKIGKLMKKYE